MSQIPFWRIKIPRTKRSPSKKKKGPRDLESSQSRNMRFFGAR
ncbi:hypothetical protein PVAP13_9KG311500 [Panicum virgatum]|uniref:Uncharacterized protein n=1 Tax=Panicum virgatum TaxID=38727 RepID=A0A8T0NUQ4_PANVG|nr:hypothetical protein PVAP13_9KG311500 [Panicum virgatum]